MTEIRSGITNRDAVLSFLDDAFEGWGDEALFEWKYDEYPGFDPDEHCYYVSQDGVAAFRRVFPKELMVDDRRVRTAILGDTAVRADRRGDGLYSTLYARTAEYCRRTESRVSITYNNLDNLTFATKKERGWSHSVLPLRLFIHSYSTVLETYADQAISSDTALTDLLEAIGDRFVLQTPGERVVLSEIFGEQSATEKTHLEAHATSAAIARLVERVSNESLLAAIPTGGRLLLSGDVSLTETTDRRRPVPDGDDDNVTVVDPEALSGDVTSSMVDLAGLVRAGAPSFRREQQDIEHMLAYPGADALIVREGPDLVGFAIVGPYENDGVLEARVLDLVAPSRAIYRRLVSKLEGYTADRGYDLLVMISNRDPGSDWATIDRQAIMWNEPEVGNVIDVDRAMPPTVTFYDVL